MAPGMTRRCQRRRTRAFLGGLKHDGAQISADHSLHRQDETGRMFQAPRLMSSCRSDRVHIYPQRFCQDLSKRDQASNSRNSAAGRSLRSLKIFCITFSTSAIDCLDRGKRLLLRSRPASPSRNTKVLLSPSQHRPNGKTARNPVLQNTILQGLA